MTGKSMVPHSVSKHGKAHRHFAGGERKGMEGNLVLDGKSGIIIRKPEKDLPSWGQALEPTEWYSTREDQSEEGEEAGQSLCGAVPRVMV